MIVGAQQQDRDHWHLDKKVPITIIFALLAQGAAGLWFVSKLESRIYALESKELSQRDRDDRQDNAVRDAMAGVARQLERMDAKLDRLVENGATKQ